MPFTTRSAARMWDGGWVSVRVHVFFLSLHVLYLWMCSFASGCVHVCHIGLIRWIGNGPEAEATSLLVTECTG